MKKRRRKRRTDKKVVDRPKKLNKLILRKRAEDRQGCISIWIMILLVSSPLWFYRGIMHEIVLPIRGEQTKAVLEGWLRYPSWSRYRHTTPTYYYAFYMNGKLYKKNAAISVKDTSYQIGDTVDILYLKALPFISSRIKHKK